MSSSEDDDIPTQTKNSKKRKSNFFDDQAELSGSDPANDSSEDEEEEDVNDYVRDGFVVDEIEDDYDEDDDLADDDDFYDGSDDGGGFSRRKNKKKSRRKGDREKKKKKRIQKQKDKLDEDDMLLIREARGGEQSQLFDESSSESEDDMYEKRRRMKKKKKKRSEEDFDEEDDMMEDDDIYQRGGERKRGQVSEAQLTEATEIFGDMSTFLEQQKRGQDGDERSDLYKERGVGVDYGVASGDDESSDDLFAESDDDKAKRAVAKKERRAQATRKRTEARKARLKRAFEPVQLIENFCTDRDDEIRLSDAPERFYDWKIPFHGTSEEEEEEEAMWIMSRIPPIAAEFMEGEGDDAEKKQRSVLDSIIHALRFMHNDKLEPDFIQRYRADIVTSKAVRTCLPLILDQDVEWDRLINARKKVDTLLTKVTTFLQEEKRKVIKHEVQSSLQDVIVGAKQELDESVMQETRLLEELAQLDPNIKKEDDEDEDLFEDEGLDEEKLSKKKDIKAHLETVQTLIKAQGEKVSQLETQVAEGAASITADDVDAYTQSQKTLSKICRDELWSWGEYHQYLSTITEVRHVSDVARYVQLLQEGNEALLQKLSNSYPVKLRAKRSRRFDRDFYRTCVSEGLRNICYKFVLSPMRVGIVLEGNQTQKEGFSYDSNRKIVEVDPDDDDVDPKKWLSPVIPGSDPHSFATELVGSGELVLLSSTAAQNKELEVHPEFKDPLKGCRYVASMELASEPRIKHYLRAIYRKYALLTTYPTSKGMHEIDAFSEFYGLQFIRNKPLSDHFPPEIREERFFGLSPEEKKEVEEEACAREHESCLQYLRIIKAERAGNIHVRIHLPFMESYDHKRDEWYKQEHMRVIKEDISPLLKVLQTIYLPIEDTQEWNDERMKILHQCFYTFLLPQFETEARRDLKDTAIKFGIKTAAQSLYHMAFEGAYRPSHFLKENRFLVPTADLPICGVSESLQEPTILVNVSERGESLDHLAIPKGQRFDNPDVVEKVTKFLINARPAAVVVGTSSGFKSRHLARNLTDILTAAMEKYKNRFRQMQDEEDDDFENRLNLFRAQHPNLMDDDDEDEEWQCNVDLVDDNVSQLFGRSVRGKKEFPETSMNMKVAVSTARYAQNPLAELCYAWSVASDAGTFGTEMLFLNISQLQQLLPKTLLLKEYERVLCHAVSEIGVDINASCTFDHLHGLLQFLPGLGPRKAASIRQAITRLGGVIESRRALLAKRIIGPTVYNNAVAFLRIREKDQLLGQHLHPLDDTRLHPDVYHKNKWAVKIAIDAMEPERQENSEEFAIKSLRDAMANSQEQVRKLFEMTKDEWEDVYGPTFNIPAWNPKINVPADSWRDNVEELDLETFAQMIENDGMGKWLSHLLMIKWEFRLPFVDPRKPMEPLTGDKLFKLLTGENDYSLRPGREMTGKVIRNTDYGSKVILEGDIPGFILTRNLSDDHVDTPDDIVKPGAIITAVICAVKKDHVSLDLSLRFSDFKKLPSDWERPKSLPVLDECYDRQAAIFIEQEKTAKRDEHLASLKLLANKGNNREEDGGRRTGRITRRACGHPAFRNAKHDEVDRELRESGDAAVGEALIRPSSQNCDSLAVHWVVRPGSIKIIEVVEEDKDADTSVGNRLRIKNEVYESIDELLGRYVAPMNDRVEEIQHHRKFKDLHEDEIVNKLVALKKAHPAQIFYFFCWNDSHPGYASLRFILGSTPRHFPIGLTPEGFQWQRKVYNNLDRLVNDFKLNPQGPGREPLRSANSARGSTKTSNTKVSSLTGITDGLSVMKPSRWGARGPAPPKPAPPQPKPNSSWGNVAAVQAPPPPIPADTRWGSSTAAASQQSTWNQTAVASTPTTNSQLPPPPAFPPPPFAGGAPPPGMPPAFPPGFQPPPPPHSAPPMGLPPQLQQQL